MKRNHPKSKQKPVRYDSGPAESSVVNETPLSMLELRQNAPDIMASLEKGVKYRLTYRGKIVGKLLPVARPPGEIPPDDAIFRLHEFSGDGPEGHLSNDELDRLVYGT